MVDQTRVGSDAQRANGVEGARGREVMDDSKMTVLIESDMRAAGCTIHTSPTSPSLDGISASHPNFQRLALRACAFLPALPATSLPRMPTRVSGRAPRSTHSQLTLIKLIFR